MRLKQLGMSTLGIILVVILLLVLLGGAPLWGHGGFGYGWGPSGLVGVVLVVVVVLLLLTDRL